MSAAPKVLVFVNKERSPLFNCLTRREIKFTRTFGLPGFLRLKTYCWLCQSFAMGYSPYIEVVQLRDGLQLFLLKPITDL